MQVHVYQINPDRDINRIRYESLNDLPKYQGSSKVDESLYDRVLRADVDCESLFLWNSLAFSVIQRMLAI